MKVLLISPLPPPAGGIATWTKLYLSSKLVQSGELEVDVVNNGVVGDRQKNYSKKTLLDELIRFVRIFKDMKKKLKWKDYDIVHLNNSCSLMGMIRDYILVKYMNLKKIPVLIHFHCDISYMIKSNFSKAILKKLCENSMKRIVLNNGSKIFLEQLGFESKNIPNFFDTSKLEDFKKVYSEKMKTILYVGHVVESKGCDELLDIAKNFPEINFRLVGNIGESYKKRKYDVNIQLTGEVSKKQVIEEMKNADLFLFLSHTEGFPNVILEAMAYKLPIISSGVGAIPEMLEDSSVIIEGENNLINYIKFIKSKKWRMIKGKQNYKKLLENYDLNNVVERLSEVYK